MATDLQGGRVAGAAARDAHKRREQAKDKLDIARDAIRLAGVHMGSIASSEAAHVEHQCERLGRELAALKRSIR